LAHQSRYASDAQVIHVSSLAGSFENWLAAFLTGDERKITGPDQSPPSAAVKPAAPGGAG
jgi:hypothetical protein